MADCDALLRKARASLDAAELLRAEGYQEFAVSRAYYAMFYTAESLLGIVGAGLLKPRRRALRLWAGVCQGRSSRWQVPPLAA